MAFVLLPLITVAQGVPVVYPGSEKVQTLTSAIKKADERITQANKYISKQKETLTQGYESAMNSVNESINSTVDSISESVSETVEKASDKISGAFSSSESGDEKAGTGFSLSKSAASVKEAYTKYGKYVSPTLGLVTGNLNLQDVMTIKDTLFIDNSKEKTKAEDVEKVRKNLREFIYESSKTTLADATQIMNGSTQFGETQKTASKKAKEATNIKEDIDTTNGAGIAMNVMTNVLLSMDITSLGVRAGTVYQEINSLKGSNPSEGLTGLVGSMGGGL